MSGMDNILSKMYAKNSDFQEIVDKYLIEGGGNQRTGTAASTAHPDLYTLARPPTSRDIQADTR